MDEGYAAGVAEEHEKEHESWVADLLDSDERFDEDLPTQEACKLERATRDVMDDFGLCPSVAAELALHGMRATETFAFPEVMRPLEGCRSCTLASGARMPLRKPSKKTPRTAWRFVGRSIKRVVVENWQCSSTCHGDPYTKNHRPAGVLWSKANGLFNVGDSWFFSLLLLEEVTELIRGTKCPPTTACEIVIKKSITFMNNFGHAHQIESLNPNTARLKLYDAWYAYDIALKRMSDDEDGYSICRLCGILPCKTGSDGCAKTAMPLDQEALSGRLDYSPHPNEPLWTQTELFRHCRRRLLRRITPGSYSALRDDPPIPVDLVPPIFKNVVYASETLYNTESEKRKAVARASDLRRGLPEPPTSQSLAAVAALVQLGQLDPVQLREGRYNQVKELDELLELAGCAPNVVSQLKSCSQKREWLLAAYETLHAGGSECHLFTISARGTGGTVTLSCPHGVVIAFKFLFTAESDRDHADVLRSLRIFPPVHWMDDSCGLVTHWLSAYKDEYEALFGPNRGCPKPWKKGEEIDLTPVRSLCRVTSMLR